MPVYCFIGFNVGDTLGRVLAHYVSLSLHTLWVPVCLRALLIPLFLMCNYTGPPTLPPLLAHSDMYPVLLMCVFSVSNGMCATLALTLGPLQAPAVHREKAGALLVVCIPYGLAMGSLLSFVF